MTSEADGVMPARRLELVPDELASALADGARFFKDIEAADTAAAPV